MSEISKARAAGLTPLLASTSLSSGSAPAAPLGLRDKFLRGGVSHGVVGAAARAAGVSALQLRTNPLLTEWTGPHNGTPPFDRVKAEHFEPAFAFAMEQNRAEISAIADRREPATFENTIAALERSGGTLSRISAVFGVWGSNRSTPEIQAIEERLSPVLAAFSDEALHNGKLFARIAAVYEQRASLTPEQQRLVSVVYTRYVQNGAKLDATAKARISEINQRLAVLQAQFSQHQLADESKALVITDKAELAGVPEELLSAAAVENGWSFANTRSVMEPLLTYAANRGLRERAFRLWTSRGDNGDANDNNALCSEILKLRTERSKLFGYATYADWHLADTMAKKPQAGLDLMMKVWKPAVAQVKSDVADMQQIVDAERGGFKIAPWDYRFYSEKVRKAKYDLDLNEVKPYLQLDNLREAMFFAAGKLYGYQFAQVKDVPTFDPDVTVYEVRNRDGGLAGLWFFDPYARAGKRSGAWMTAYREQRKLDGPVTTIVSNNSNFVKGQHGEPTTIAWDDANTMFHEFGHALHGLASNVTYPTLSGTNTPRDHVEFPSQVHENWLSTPEILKLLVDKNGKPLPQELVDKIKRAATFNQGFATVEMLASAIVDMKLHMTDQPVDTRAFETQTLAELGMPAEIVMRHRIPHFGHIFSDEGYAAGYYGYVWAETLSADAWEAFTETGNPFDPAVAQRLHDLILAVGNTVPPEEAYRAFRGRDATPDALLRAKGFPVEA